MSLDAANGEVLTPDESRLLAVVPPTGQLISNMRARDRTSWSSEKYWAVRDSLLDKELIVRGRGRGGTVRQVLAGEAEQGSVSSDSDVTEAHRTDSLRRNESLHPGIRTVLETDWAKDRRIHPVAVEAVPGRDQPAADGDCSQPDLVTVEVKTYEYVPGKFLDLTTFEVRSADAIDVRAVHEALAHRASATRAYVWLHVPLSRADQLEPAVQSVLQTARMHGIGVIVASSPSDHNSWDEREPAQRVQPDPERLNEFISKQLSRNAQQQITQHLR